MNDYYVYVYIDPRNYEEFYYGKGKGARKFAHLKDGSDTDKTKRLSAIKSAGLLPIIRVIATGLTQDQALLIEKTLIWKLGKSLTNISQGHFSENFRPHDTLHKYLPGFDFRKEIYYVNVGEGPHRRWNDCRKYGFISAGQDPKWSVPLKSLCDGDCIVAYLKGAGYVGIGIVTSPAIRVADFRYKGKRLDCFPLEAPNMFANADDENYSEYLLAVRWIKTVERDNAFFKPKGGLFTTPLIRASLSNQPKTLDFVERSFQLSISDLMKENES